VEAAVRFGGRQVGGCRLAPGGGRRALVAGAWLVLAFVSTAGADGLPRPVLSPPPPRPDGGTEVPVGASLGKALADAPPGAVLILAPGEYPGPITIDRPVTVWGPRTAVIRSGGRGTTVDVTASGVRLLGFSVAGSGTRFEDTDAGVRVLGDDVTVEGLRITGALFGIVVSGVHRARVVGNNVVGSGVKDFGLRGDAIRFWEVRDAVIEGNHVEHSRDIVVWYSPGNRIEGNLVEWGRYGTHFMYSSRNQVLHNTYLHNLVGVFVMYCDNVDVTENLMAASDPGEGMGLGLKEAGNVRVSGNRFLRNPTGVFIDTSPIQISHENSFTDNAIEFCDTGVMFHSSEKQNVFTGNAFHGCAYTVRVDGRGDATHVRWAGNYFEDYAGFDLDHDGVGDVPHEPRSLANQLTSSRDQFRFFRGTPALGLLDVVSRVLPILTPKVMFTDPTPRLHRPAFAQVPKKVPEEGRR
jgi:nitrous oxidase accessory protein